MRVNVSVPSLVYTRKRHCIPTHERFILDWIVLSASALQEEQAKHCNNIIVFHSVHLKTPNINSHLTMCNDGAQTHS